METVNNAGCVIGILAAGKSQAQEIKAAEEKTDPSAVIESAPAASTSVQDTTMADVDKEKIAAKASEGAPKRAGLVLAAEKRVTSKLLDKDAGGGREKIFAINEYAAYLCSIQD